MSAIKDTRTICRSEQWRDGLFCHMGCEEDRLHLQPPHHAGVCCLPPLDSGEKGFAWSRLTVSAALPQDCGLRLYARCADQPAWAGWDELRRTLPEQEGAGLSEALRAQYGAPLPPGTDCLIEGTGRYLWLAVELTATGGAQPSVQAFTLRMGGDHMLDYLPSIYRGDDFTARFLSIFSNMLQDMEDAVEALPRQLDPASAPDDMLDFLAQWVCIEPGEGDARARMQTALDEYETMYTTKGVQRSVRRLTGRDPLLIEHFMVDPNRADCRNPVLYRRLYGDDPYRFFILLSEDAFASRDRMEHFLSRMQELIPAGMRLELVLLKPRVQLDWHTYLGVNSRLGGYVPAVIDETVTIHYDTMIGGATT